MGTGRKIKHTLVVIFILPLQSGLLWQNILVIMRNFRTPR